MSFSNPLALLLLLSLLPIAIVGWPTRGENKRREVISLVIRMILSLCLILAAAGLEIANIGNMNALAVVFVMDVSDSMSTEDKDQALDFIRQALEKMGPDDQAALVVFAKEALVERPMSKGKDLGPIISIPDPGGSDLAEAIQLGLALFPPNAARRMVILSDGSLNGRVDANSTAITAARLASAAGVEVVVAPMGSALRNEILVREFNIPANLNLGDIFRPEIVIESSQDSQINLRVFSNGEVIYEENRSLEKGTNRISSITLQAKGAGFTEYRLQISPISNEASSNLDRFYQNNSLAAFSEISGAPQVLIVAPQAGEVLPGGEKRPDEYSILRSLLSSQPGGSNTVNYQVSYRRPVDFPLTWNELINYNAVVMIDVPARELNQSQMTALQRYVSDLGGGLVVVGGPTSYGVGGYFKTTLEEILPVEMQIKDEERRPSLSIVYIIDHSGSMADSAGGVTKLELAKEAVVRSLDLLMPGDRVGIIAFDDQAMWVVDMTELSDPASVRNAVGSIREGGGTDILAGVQAMARVLSDEPSKTKHAILLTDGGADPTGIPELIESLLAEDRITLSTIGVGQDAADFLDDLAVLGGGRYHFASNPSQIPQIFAEETSLATRAYIVEETFFPELVRTSLILEEIASTPALYGYVATSAKANANLILQSEQGDPILAEWNYGLGKVIAFTSDATGRWAKEWAAWDGFARFWLNCVSFVESQPVSSNANFSIQNQGEVAVLQIDVRDEQSGGYLNGQELAATVIDPDGEEQAILLEQTAPGQYRGIFAPTTEGSYQVSVQAEDESKRIASFGWIYTYSPEYKGLEADPDALLRIAAAANGRMIGLDPSTTFVHTTEAPGIRQPMWPTLLAVALFLLPFDIAIRRLIITRRDLMHLSQWLARQVKRSPSSTVIGRSERMETLLRVRERTAKNYTDDVSKKDSSKRKERLKESPPAQANPLILPIQPPEAGATRQTTTPELEKKAEGSSTRDDSISKLLQNKRTKNP